MTSKSAPRPAPKRDEVEFDDLFASPRPARREEAGSDHPHDNGEGGALAVLPTPAVASAPVKSKRPGKQAESPTEPEAELNLLGEMHNLQCEVPLSLHNRYRRLSSDLRHSQRFSAMQRQWVAGLLYRGPQSAAELRELVERVYPETEQAYTHDRTGSVVNGDIPMALYLRYTRWIDDLLLDERFRTSMTKVIVCLMHEGPQTAAQLRKLVEDWKQLSGE